MIHHFTRFDDELILANSQGKISYKFLRRHFRRRWEAAQERALILGVRIYKGHVSRRAPVPNWQPMTDTLRPSEITDDKLLKRLMEVHGDGPDVSRT
jgi:hypothetical protein